MAGLKSIWSFLLLCLLSQCAPSLQTCPRPEPDDPNVILTPSSSAYLIWVHVFFSCPTGYTASSGNDYSLCHPGWPDYWYPEISTVITCTLDPIVTIPPTEDIPDPSVTNPPTEDIPEPIVTTRPPGEIPAEAMIFVADYSGRIYMADFSSDRLDSLTFSSLPLGSVLQPIAVDFDPDTRMVYWTESSGSIRRGNIDGTSQSVIASGLGKPEGLALDTSRGKVFWTDYSLDRIVSADLDGSSQQILIDTDIYKPRAIIVDQEAGVMFWTDWNYPESRIERANLDGGDRYVIVDSSLKWPNGLAFNADGSRIYWCDAGFDMIESVDLWGEDRTVHLATSSIHPFDLAVVDDSILWTDDSYDEIGITSNDNDSSFSFYYPSLFVSPRGMHVYKG